MPERDTYFSSDIASISQNLDIVATIYGPFREYFNGLELVAKGNVDKVQRKIRYAQDDLGFQQISLHGRIGSPGSSRLDAIKVLMVDATFLKTPDILSNFGSSHEVLLHTPEVLKPDNLEVLKNTPNLKWIWVENDHPEHTAVIQAIQTVQLLRYYGIRSGLMFDICHALGVKALKRGDISKDWDLLRTFTEEGLLLNDQNSDYPIWQGMHLPIGSVLHDSLPIDKMPDSMLTDIARWLDKGHPRLLVVENQHSPFTRFTSKDILRIQRHTGSVFDRLQNHGIIYK